MNRRRAYIRARGVLKRRPWVVPVVVLIMIAPGLVQCVRDGEALAAALGAFTVGLMVNGLAFDPFTRSARLRSAEWKRLYFAQKRLGLRALKAVLGGRRPSRKGTCP